MCELNYNMYAGWWQPYISNHFRSLLAMSEPAAALKEAQRWATIGVAFAKNRVGVDGLLWATNSISSSSMFSGCGFAERACDYIHEGRLRQDTTLPRFSASWLIHLLSFAFIDFSTE